MDGKAELMTTEFRRLHVIYFLSRMGRIEHPHLIRIHHASRNGVYLRDVKRWLSDLRGKEMPDSFTWSYKRRYKTGYVWQDLMDGDLITPIADNEFVLKGSEISSVPSDRCSYGERKGLTEKPEPVEDKSITEIAHTKMKVSPKTSEIEIGIAMEQESSQVFHSETRTVLEDLMKSDAIVLHEEENNREKKNKKSSTENAKTPLPFTNVASNVFKNLLSCGAVDINDSALKTISRDRRSSTCPPQTIDESSDCNPQTNQKNSRKSSNGRKNSKTTNEKKTASAACKPVTEPICSQCRKRFNPEKLHSHMKSCRGMKSVCKTANNGGNGSTKAPEKVKSTRLQKFQ